jgi:hypothetical protein
MERPVEVVPWDLMVLRVVLAKMGPVIIRTVLVMGGQQEQEGAIQELQERMWTMDAVILEQLAQLEVQVPTCVWVEMGEVQEAGDLSVTMEERVVMEEMVVAVLLGQLPMAQGALGAAVVAQIVTGTAVLHPTEQLVRREQMHLPLLLQ